ncbi:MAG TPA: Rho termination factor N-terminal domain-containing protein, partial [Bacteroidales bacterium]|nr:Rho termination factor N-terminal domain-containing protein [Bacteroidales bacterium]HQI11150.1 Rho termination factor N-terminal domain-containing protein [Bacteroidales bacterium]HQJ12728.1 Rho termination factor N-terminal domain-containing protein [Bacteroidales bacterium]
MHDILELSEMLVPELREIARQLKIKRVELLKKQDLIYKILDQQAIDAAETRKTGRAEKQPSDKKQDQSGQQKKQRKPDKTTKSADQRRQQGQKEQQQGQQQQQQQQQQQ